MKKILLFISKACLTISKACSVLVLGVITFYKRFISGFIVTLFGHSCRFEPTCSEYAYGAIERHGVLKGGKMAITRIIKCNPMTKPQFDPVK